MITVKINVGKVSLKVLLKTMAKMTNYMNETSFLHSITKRQLQIKAQAQAADFFTPNLFSDTIVLEKGCPEMLDWPEHDLVNTKQGWEILGVINGNLISGDHYYYAGHAYLIPQTMAGIDIELDSEEFQEWYYGEFTTFPSQAISEALYQINAVINNTLQVEIGPIFRSRAIFMVQSVTKT